MIRRNSRAIAMSAVIGAVFLLNWTDAEWIGPATAHAQPSGTPSPAGTPIPVDPGTGQNPPPCPPPSFTFNNTFGHSVDIVYTCSNNTATGVTVPAGDSYVFDGDGNQQCSGCDDNDDDCTCVNCGLVRLVLLPGATIFTCQMQQAYMEAYGLDLAASTLDGNVVMGAPEPRYDRLGGRMQQWAIPVLNEDRELVGWEFTTIEPIFSVENGEVVIRSHLREVIGGPEGITLGKKNQAKP